MTLAEWMQENCKKFETNPTDLAGKIDEKQPTLFRVFAGKVKNPNLDLLKKLETYFGNKYDKNATKIIFDENRLIESKNKKPTNTRLKKVTLAEIVSTKDPLNDMAIRLGEIFMSLSEHNREILQLLANKMYEHDQPQDGRGNGKSGKINLEKKLKEKASNGTD